MVVTCNAGKRDSSTVDSVSAMESELRVRQQFRGAYASQEYSSRFDVQRCCTGSTYDTSEHAPAS